MYSMPILIREINMSTRRARGIKITDCDINNLITDQIKINQGAHARI